MEAGYDWLLVRAHVRRRLLRLFGMAMVGAGVVLLGGSGAYYAYGQWAQARLADLARPVVGPVANTGTVDEFTLDSRVSGGPGTLAPPTTLTQAIPALRLYPGELVPARFWVSTAAYEPPDVHQQALVAGFTPVQPQDVAPLGTLSRAVRIQVPAIDLASTIKELAILNVGDVRAYETPNRVVGHIPESANSGEGGTGWFFGHLESPIRGEGAVFRALPEIPELRRQGQEVFVILENEEGTQYLYRVFDHQVVYQDDLELTDAGRPTIALVTCVPSLIYDHRLVVWGELVGVKR